MSGTLGAGVGAVAGSFLGSTRTGGITGAASGAGRGILRGAAAGQREARRQAREQIRALALKPAEVRRDFTVGGYVFFPTGSYKDLEVLAVNRETGETETFRTPWR